ncbi:MAG: asparagine synthase (glutamine-hydrolyzing) [Anaerolineales bacterium]|jgi:asparagine synthase (glutamine-hydrolysing)
MCGIIGVLNQTDQPPVEEAILRQMLEMIRHRGPDGIGIYRDAHIGLGNARLSIIDIGGGDQPIGNEDGSMWIVFNGEIFNYVELRPLLESRGHIFSTKSDTEVILHLYEDFGPDCLQYLNGQFAIAIWDNIQQRLFLARDRVGIRPLFYTFHQGRFIFGSEIKSILAFPGIQAEIDPASLKQVFTYWSVQTPRTIFKRINEVPPGHFAVIQNKKIKMEKYWSLGFAEETHYKKSEEYLEEFENLLVDATQIRLRSDVPVGAYLSGGLDSSITTAIIRNYTKTHLDTFSISFSDQDFDESPYQRKMANFLGTDHHEILTTCENIGFAFPEVVWHTEVPILRTAPTPMFLLSKLVHEYDYKVVLTGEGADELLAGYDIFKEMKIRRFWAKDPTSQKRPLLLRRLYPDISGMGSTSAFRLSFFKKGLTHTTSPYYSHTIRWTNTSRTWRFLARDQEAPEGEITPDSLVLPAGFDRWSPLAQAQFLEITTFLSPYLLSSQGDRMAMGHSVEGRYPFLDYRVIEYCNQLPSNIKMPVLIEKWLLKQLGKKLLPDFIWQRNKRPYRAPIHSSFFTTPPPEYVQELLSEKALQSSGYFEPAAVTKLARKAVSGVRMSEVEDMALVGILSTQLVDQLFVKGFKIPTIRPQKHIKVIDHVPVSN